MAKCYFAKHKLVWELLDGNLKNKIEIQWSDIVALKATYAEDGLGTLDVVVSYIFVTNVFSPSYGMNVCTLVLHMFNRCVFALFCSWRDSPFSLGR